MKTLMQYAAHLAVGGAIGAIITVGTYLLLVQLGVTP